MTSFLLFFDYLPAESYPGVVGKFILGWKRVDIKLSTHGI